MQKITIARKFSLAGIGIHSGETVNLELMPSSSGRIVFVRTDLDGKTVFPDPGKAEAKFSTILASDAGEVRTVEHLLASVFALGIDSLRIEIDGAEVPAMDGSALPFCESLLKAGTADLPEEKKPLRIVRPIRITEDHAELTAEPSPNLVVEYEIDYDHPAIGRQGKRCVVNPTSFRSEIAPARTFGFLKDVPALTEMGLAGGGSLENALILNETGLVNGPLRFPDEFVRHKILDFLGDLSLIGHPVFGRFDIVRGGHHLHLKAVRFILDHPEYWEQD